MSPGAFAWRAIINGTATKRQRSLVLARQIILIHHLQRLARAFNVISMAPGAAGDKSREPHKFKPNPQPHLTLLHSRSREPLSRSPRRLR